MYGGIRMPLCTWEYTQDERYISDKDILIRKRRIQIYMVGEGERVPDGDAILTDYTVSTRTPTTIKTAYVKVGDVCLGWFTLHQPKGICIKEILLPTPFGWKEKWPSLDKLIDCNISEKIREEFGITIGHYVGRQQ